MWVFLCLSALILLITSDTITQSMQANLFQFPSSLHLLGPLDRRKHLETQPHAGRITMSNATTTSQPIPLNLTLSMLVTPFEEIYSEESHIIFTADVKLPQKAGRLKMECMYEKGRKIRVSSYLESGQKHEVQQAQKIVSILVENTVMMTIQYQGAQMLAGTIETVVTFREKEPTFKGIVSKFTIQVHNKEVVQPILDSQQPHKWIGQIQPISHPISLKGLVIPQNIKSTKLPHKIPALGEGKKLLVCHDMANGYKEDINEWSNKFGKHAYRFNHWKITDIFVYFSHENIAIPPKHYLSLCKREKVLCLATFIVEAKLDWLNLALADYLIYLAREYEFDGYLINVEYPVDDAPRFKHWLGYLTNNIHSQLPNSTIVLYDAIVNDGSLRHQSGLSQLNIDYMNHVDSFFSDYHWNLNSLQNTVAMAESIGRGPDVFMGNDVFGRGTWGGGMLNTYKAVNEINKYNLSTAIFAPGFVYETMEGKQSYQRFESNDDSLWFGRSVLKREIKFEEWFYATQGWRQEGNEAVTSANECQREFKFYVKDMVFDSALLSVMVKGTPPNVLDPYRIVLELLTDKGELLASVTTGNNFNYGTADEREIKLRLFTREAHKGKYHQIRVREIGRDAQNWGGNYGIRFRADTLFLTTFNLSSSITQYFVERPSQLPFHSYYNVAVSPNYFFEGRKISDNTGYNFLSDYDLPYQNKIFFKVDEYDQKHNSSLLSVEYSQNFGWIGAGSLQVDSTVETFALRLIKTSEKMARVNVKLMVKVEELPLIGVKFQGGEVLTGKVTLIEKGNGWSQLQSSFSFGETKQVIGVYLVCDFLQPMTQPIHIGEISVFGQISPHLKLKKEPNLVSLRCSLTSVNCLDLYIDMKEMPDGVQQVFVEVNKKVVGTMREPRWFFEELEGDPENVSVRLLGVSFDGMVRLFYEEEVKGV